MASLTIDSTHPSATINLATLKNCLGKLLEADKRGGVLPNLAPDEYVLLNELLMATTDGTPSATNNITSIVINY